MRRVIPMLVCALAVGGLVSGCGGTPAPKTASGEKPHADHAGHKDGDEDDHEKTAKSGKAHDHSGWWCNEHGVPEEICSLCDSKVAAELQKKGDWCKEHDRADSQCFICHPELEAKFAAQYEAKYGKKPPKPEVN